mmetsp:Transcript_31361/g.78450  ORF Transcript_31361/g.78450 Transcript_31361/m.78450 type:complete len:95 (-) Transcript_31361:50-334(-)
MLARSVLLALTVLAAGPPGLHMAARAAPVPDTALVPAAETSELHSTAASDLDPASTKHCCGEMPWMGSRYACLSTTDCLTMHGKIVDAGLCGGC